MIRAVARHTIPIAIVLAATSAAALAATDEIAEAWSTRADRAAKRLTQPGLDACDVAYERAFQRAKENARPPFRVFDLAVEISGQTLRASNSLARVDERGNRQTADLIELGCGSPPPQGQNARQQQPHVLINGH